MPATPQVQATTSIIQFYFPPPHPDSVFLKTARPWLTNSVFTYTIVISNSGNLPALNVVMTDVIPVGAAYVPNSLSCSTGTCWDDGTAVYWSGQVLTQALPVSVAFAVTAIAESGPIVNTAVITDPALLGEVTGGRYDAVDQSVRGL
jgi:uncharacterized repeat protein (TIGR01451 family)